jgi:cysteine desulfurase / selenocysteine lyase
MDSAATIAEPPAGPKATHSDVATDVAADWSAFRAAFPTTERYVYLDTARKALVPRWVEQAMQSWVKDVYENAGMAAFSMDMIEAARNEIAETFGAPARNLALIKNTSEGINIIAQGLNIAPGENVVLSEYEHENNTFPWRYVGRKGVDVRIIPAAKDGRIPLDHYRAAIDDKTRVVTVAWVAYGNGMRADIAAIAAIAHKRGAFVVVDGVQAVGLIDQRIDALGADALVAGGHKAMMSLAGAGFLYIRDSALDRIAPPYAAKFSFTSLDRTVAELELAADAHRFEYGNPNFLGIWVQQHSAREIRRVKLGRIEARIRALTDRLISGLDAKGIRVRTPRPWNERAGIVSMDTGKSARETVACLAKRGIVVSEKDGFVRASIHAYNNEQDVDALLDAIA